MALDREKLQYFIDKHQGKKKSLIAILQEIQSEYRYLPEECLRFVAKSLGVSLTDVVAVATF